ncbi:MAG: hypothetical protein ACREUU_09795, partial [Gammaproteobacteria bacterium]
HLQILPRADFHHAGVTPGLLRVVEGAFQGNLVGAAPKRPTETQLAAGRPEQQIITRQYHLATGVVQTETDPNNVTTIFNYDALGRRTLEQKGTAVTATEYSDSQLHIITRRDHKQANDRALVTVQRFDPLLRLRLTQQLEAPSPSVPDESAGIKMKRVYSFSAAGNFQAVSNPYRAETDATMAWTRTSFDKAGRVAEVRHYSGSMPPSPWSNNTATSGAVTSTYSVDETQVCDEAASVSNPAPENPGACRKTIVDGAGRMTKVVESPAGVAYETSYQYDALDNLTLVCQGGTISGTTCNPPGREREFSYDSLERLKTAMNPESGTIAYEYL